MQRRQFARLAGISLASTGLAGCGSPGAGTDETATPGLDDADVSMSFAMKAPGDLGPFEEVAGEVITEQRSDAVTVDSLTFQRAGEKGLVVAGDAVNASDRSFETVTVAVALYDGERPADSSRDPVTERENHGQLDSASTWQWAATFGEEPAFEIGSFTVTVAANYP